MEDDTGTSSDRSGDGIFSYSIAKIPTLIFRVILFFGGMYLFTWMMQNANGKMGEKYKFEVKTAKDID
jgi:hypothetical protein